MVALLPPPRPMAAVPVAGDRERPDGPRLRARQAVSGRPAAIGRDPRSDSLVRVARRGEARAPFARRAAGASRRRAPPARRAGRRRRLRRPDGGSRAQAEPESGCAILPRRRSAQAGMRTEGLKVIGTTDEIGPICDRLARRGGDRDPVRSRRCCAQVVAACRDRGIGANAPDRVRAASRRGAAHAPAARGPGGGRPRARSGGHGARAGRRLPRGQAGAGDRRGARSAPSSAARSRACGRGCW